MGYDYGNRIGLDVAGHAEQQRDGLYPHSVRQVGDLSVIESNWHCRLQYEDGFAAFINGKKVASDNAPTTLNWKSGAPSEPTRLERRHRRWNSTIPNVKNVLG